MSIEYHNADFTSKRFLYDLGTSLNKIRVNVEVIFYVSLSLSMFSYISMTYIFRQYLKKWRKKIGKEKESILQNIFNNNVLRMSVDTNKKHSLR